MRSFVKVKSTRNGGTTLSFTDKVDHAKVSIFNVANMSFNAIREKKILAKSSEFTEVLKDGKCFFEKLTLVSLIIFRNDHIEILKKKM